jgi:hypothetical protein
LLASIDKQGENFTNACPKMKDHHGTGGERRELENKEKEKSLELQGGSNMSSLRALALANAHSLASSLMHAMMADLGASLP